MWRKWSSFADSERQTILSQMGLQDVSEESGVGLLSLFRGLDGMSLHSLVQQSLIGESNHQKDSFMGSNLLEKVGRWFRFSSPTTPAVRLSEHDVLLGKYFFDCIHRHRVETSLMKVLQSAESCHVRSSYADAKTLEDVSHWGKLDMFHLTQDNAANSRLIEEDIPRAIEKGKRAIIVLPADLADDLKVQAIASVQTTVGEDDYLFVFLGRPDAFTESLATVSLAVTISPVDFPRGTGNAAQSVPPPSQHWSRLVEVSFGGIHSTFPKENHSAVQRFLRFQAVSLSIVQELGNSFVLTRNGLVGAGLLSVLCAFLSVHCRDLKHLRRAEEDIQRSLRFTSPVVDLLTPTSTATVFRAFKRLKPLTLSSDHEFGYLDERDFLQVAQGSIPALTTTLDCPPPSKEARQLLCFLLDYSLSALLEEYVLSVEDMNILSIAVLRLHPASGGIFGLAQQSFGGVESVFFDMCELCEENENVHFSSLPFVRDLKERNINFDGISQEVLHRARQTLARH
ncbi:hypothetical protein AGDE_13727 [Angomonas deanei]|nr:hypothetical protein AGDE_13727 [Angomonas deanei]|eukprot:EPY21885.1 hypothetical protein AGDE_13727 [Angomonas deanei]